MNTLKPPAVLCLALALAACAGTSSSVRPEEPSPTPDAVPEAAPALQPEPEAAELVLQADEASRQQRSQEARELLNRALVKDPSCAEAHLRLARLEAASGGLEAAFGHLTSVLESQPDHREALQLAAALAPSLPPRLPQAIQLVRRALDSSPDDAGWLALLAELLHKSGDAPAARAVLAQLLTVHPNDGRACVLLAFDALDEGRPKEALFHARRAAARLPEDAAAHHALGSALAALRTDGDDSEAVRHLSLSVRLDGRDPAAWFDLGRVLLRNRDCAGAEKAFRQARSLAPEVPFLTLALAAAVEAQRDAAGSPRFGEAEELYRQAMAAMPGSPEAAAALADLKAGPMKDFRGAEALYVLALERLPQGARRSQMEAALKTVRQRLAAEEELSKASAGAQAP